ncbi:MAG: hypothetical protein WC617_16025 [Rhodanobacter sp.]
MPLVIVAVLTAMLILMTALISLVLLTVILRLSCHHRRKGHQYGAEQQRCCPLLLHENTPSGIAKPSENHRNMA